MKNIVIYATVSGKSARALAQAINERSFGECKARVVNPYKVDARINKGDIIFSYGCSSDNKTPFPVLRLNTRNAVLNCIDKRKTFVLLKKAGVPTVEYVTKMNQVPAHWDRVVVRDEVNGRKSEGLNYCYNENVSKYPHANLFTEYFDHKYEHRVVVFKGVILGRYFKSARDGDWFFNPQPSRGFETMDAACIKAAAVLGIDYVGFDVVSNSKKDFRILEANSGPVLTTEAETAIVEYFMNLA